MHAFGLHFLEIEGSGELWAVGVGTPAYMSPEAAEGSADIDHRSDIYALGCVSYTLLTGTLVFDSDSPVGMLVHHLKTPPQPPSLRTELPIPAALEEILMRCLEKDPARRPQSAEELSSALNGVELPHTWDQDRARAWWSLHLPDAN